MNLHRKLFAGSLLYGSNKDTLKIPQFAKTLLYSEHTQGKTKFITENDKDTSNFHKLKHHDTSEQAIALYIKSMD